MFICQAKAGTRIYWDHHSKVADCSVGEWLTNAASPCSTVKSDGAMQPTDQRSDPRLSGISMTCSLDYACPNYASLNLDVDKCIEWLEQRGVPKYCQNRFRIVMDARTRQDHEIATLVGVPVIDELSRSLYDGRDFTTKRGKMPKPQLACSKAGSDEKLNRFCEGFVDKFGLIQQQVDLSRLEDEDHFNRPAILYGMMRRAYGSKDTAKVFMVLLFLIFAYKEGSGED